MIKPKSGNQNWDRHIFLKPWGLGGDAKSLLFIVQYLEMSLFHAPLSAYCWWRMLRKKRCCSAR